MGAIVLIYKSSTRFGWFLLVAILAVATMGFAPAHAHQHQYSWHMRTLDVPAAWELSTGQGITVAVIDSGIDATHPDLINVVHPGRNFVPDTAPLEAEAGLHEAAHTDPAGHGTAIAGLIAGNGTTTGSIGIAPDARLLPVRVLDEHNRYHDSTVVADALTWAVDEGADIINLSLGGANDNRAVAEALEYARKNDVLVIACTGNVRQGRDNQTIWFPARNDNTLAVTGTGRDGRLWPSALTGPETQLAAPAAELPAAIPGGGRGHVTGTSFATALVSGTAALLRSANPDLDAAAIATLMTETASSPTWSTDQLGAGIIDPVAALSEDPGRFSAPGEDLGLTLATDSVPVAIYGWLSVVAIAALAWWGIRPRLRKLAPWPPPGNLASPLNHTTFPPTAPHLRNPRAKELAKAPRPR
ncbi:S8 family serine peptidase [Natronoglycomyces albus]|uniref:S8 family serine peptidase n=1 Tax=Natronoglycomyces albus TaxID=2811108 RepID=A0A895XRR9_9ACTN|nr:S8 family serine peptidase [Natronoglycomyces albus]QSB04950.1 S8 family serine peptidase [Natronoglycomyces albus]